MNKPSILKSVSISEMLHLRETGLSNAEIADKIGCSYNTVNRHIGKAPFKKARQDRHKELPASPAGDKPIPEMPRKSFAERCEEMRKREEEAGKKVVLAENLVLPERTITPGGDIHRFSILPKAEWGKAPEAHILPSDADAAREAHRKAVEMIDTPYTSYKEERSHIPELIAMFGPDAVVAWLKVSLYDMGIPDCKPMSRQKMLETLKIMNAEVSHA